MKGIYILYYTCIPFTFHWTGIFSLFGCTNLSYGIARENISFVSPNSRLSTCGRVRLQQFHWIAPIKWFNLRWNCLWTITVIRFVSFMLRTVPEHSDAKHENVTPTSFWQVKLEYGVRSVWVRHAICSQRRAVVFMVGFFFEKRTSCSII